MKKKRYYIAYGSNISTEQMSMRCPAAVVEGVSEVQDYMLLFRGRSDSAVATIEPLEGSSVPVAIWSISPSDERSLDIYEGYPRLYTKEEFIVELNGKPITAMAYVMTPGKSFGKPSGRYIDTIFNGYEEFGFDMGLLSNAIFYSRKAMKSNSLLKNDNF